MVVDFAVEGGYVTAGHGPHRLMALGGKVVLANVHTLESRRPAKIGAVVHDQPGAVADPPLQLACLIEYLGRMAGLVAVLEQSNTAPQEFFSEGTKGRRLREMGCVGDGVEAGKNHELSDGVILSESEACQGSGVDHLAS